VLLIILVVVVIIIIVLGVFFGVIATILGVMRIMKTHVHVLNNRRKAQVNEVLDIENSMALSTVNTPVVIEMQH